mmetsp:Transcript_39690/g.45191  ORF Transcript_39690/g.45191 Transcript_39690/m.45191 type:complete len:93 (-) Transcript_39690:1990-2268(-)
MFLSLSLFPYPLRVCLTFTQFRLFHSLLFCCRQHDENARNFWFSQLFKRRSDGTEDSQTEGSKREKNSNQCTFISIIFPFPLAILISFIFCS